MDLPAERESELLHYGKDYKIPEWLEIV